MKYREHILAFARLSVLVPCLLTGCGFIQDNAPGTVTPKRGAKLIAIPDLSIQPTQKLLTYYSDSYAECLTFKEGMISTMTGVNAGSDYAALLLTTLGSVLSPVATLHALSAGAAAVTGLKSTYANDVAAGNAVNLTIAFDKIYFQPMARLAETSLSAATSQNAVAAVLSQIVSLQSQCSLDEARAYINLNLNQAAPRTASGHALSTATR